MRRISGVPASPTSRYVYILYLLVHDLQCENHLPLHTHTHIYTHIYTHTHIHTHIHTHTQLKRVLLLLRDRLKVGPSSIHPLSSSKIAAITNSTPTVEDTTPAASPNVSLSHAPSAATASPSAPAVHPFSSTSSSSYSASSLAGLPPLAAPKFSASLLPGTAKSAAVPAAAEGGKRDNIVSSEAESKAEKHKVSSALDHLGRAPAEVASGSKELNQRSRSPVSSRSRSPSPARSSTQQHFTRSRSRSRSSSRSRTVTPSRSRSQSPLHHSTSPSVVDDDVEAAYDEDLNVLSDKVLNR